MDWAPRRRETGLPTQAGAAAALMTDNERKAFSTRVPCFHVLDGTIDADETHMNLYGAEGRNNVAKEQRQQRPGLAIQTGCRQVRNSLKTRPKVSGVTGRLNGDRKIDSSPLTACLP